jgi:hypothetical protein
MAHDDNASRRSSFTDFDQEVNNSNDQPGYTGDKGGTSRAGVDSDAPGKTREELDSGLNIDNSDKELGDTDEA